ncbi:C40 family peptidase [Actinomadura luzonensis]|uniref:C40 family peptidase n=1 Tax=Actinomadura luzonensis TaxID=2805427 RepID=UPI0038991190
MGIACLNTPDVLTPSNHRITEPPTTLPHTQSTPRPSSPSPRPPRRPALRLPGPPDQSAARPPHKPAKPLRSPVVHSPTHPQPALSPERSSAPRSPPSRSTLASPRQLTREAPMSRRTTMPTHGSTSASARRQPPLPLPLALTCALLATFTVLTPLLSPQARAATVPAAEAAPHPHPRARKKTPTRGEIAATAALTQLGVRFSWGGGSRRGPTRGIGRGSTTEGFDCSGLTLYAWSRAGIALSHHTGAQFRQGRRITLKARRPGDLLFFGGGRGTPTHVALYLGGSLMIHAPKTGDVVRRTNFLRSPYYRTVYRGTVRPG